MSSQKLTKSKVAQVRKMLSATQNEECALCGVSFLELTMVGKKKQPKYKRALDHCHNHGHVRAVLCNNCNGIEGQIFNRARRCKRDGTELEWLEKLVAYLQLHKTPQTPFIHPDHKSADDKRVARNAQARKRRALQTAKARLNK